MTRANPTPLPTFLPGALTLSRGTPRDYLELERFHYLPKRPATWAAVWSIHYTPAQNEPTPSLRASVPSCLRPFPVRLIAVAVLSYPTVNSAARDRALGIAHWPPARKLAYVNRHVRTISRVIVHPQFRGVGLAARLVRHCCAHRPTRHLEAFALMGRVNPFFEKGGMHRHPNPDPEAPIYYSFDKASPL